VLETRLLDRRQPRGEGDVHHGARQMHSGERGEPWAVCNLGEVMECDKGNGCLVTVGRGEEEGWYGQM